ncbi:MAG TPA: LysM peptidoglycan-binding domain-containing protein, partial [Rhodothermales bacterium]
VAQLKSWNNLRSNTIQVGQRLYLYENGAGGQVAESKPTEHRVRRGDTLGEIATRYGVTVAQIKSWNSLKSSTIVPGQRLKVDGPSEGMAQVTHRVRRGDSLGKIAKQYGVSVRQIKDWNGLRSNTIYPGQRLTINS